MSKKQIRFLDSQQPFVSGVSVAARLDTGSVKLEPIGERSADTQDELGAHRQEEHDYADEQQHVSLTLRLSGYEDAVVGSMEASIAQENVFFKQRSFAAQRALTVELPEFPRLERALAYYHFNEWWTRPAFRKGELRDLPERIQSVLWSDGSDYLFLLPIPHPDWKIELHGAESGLTLSLSPELEGIDRCRVPAFIVKRGKEPFALIKETFEWARRISGLPLRWREERRYPEALDYLGWCSWDAFYHDVSEQGIIGKLEELKGKGVPVRWIMIDDGWQHVRDKMMLSFEADKDKFPQGLEAAIHRIKQDYGVRWVGVWHTLFGYWGGIHPEGGVAAEYGEYLYKTRNGKKIPYPEAARGFGFWNAFHSYLRQAGVDIVKVDSQGAVANFLTHHLPSGRAAAGMHAALEASTGIHFDQRLINCMGMTSENMWSRPASAVSRNSDDFVPGKEISFREHALQNAYNSLYHGLVYWGDWDMFWTAHEEAKQNAVLRAVSGGPVYFSDRVGATDPQDLLPLILRDGRVLRGDHPGLPTPDMLLTDPHRERVPLKVWNTLGESAVLALFHIHEEDEPVKGSFAAADIPSLKDLPEGYLFYDYDLREAKRVARDERIECELGPAGTKLGVFVPWSDRCTPIGLLGKYLAPLTVETVSADEGKAVYRLPEEGEFGFAAKVKPAAVYVGGKPVQLEERTGYYVVQTGSVENEGGTVLVELEWA
ncbi:Sip1-related alpha-galactosidase [Paenibacillus ginsengihumi]|uniref:Sip1-related alpha-galactosidase n=1 Tax=Paenibacillus ginsengihumi TaxID=431596 RepID=UPI000379F8E8|nr:Sip1-related alpha-galactosidase [Paenibacillus ginsengihumi]